MFRLAFGAMKVVCSQSELNGALQLVSRAVATRPTHPVLANVLLTADAGSGRLSLTGFDLNLGIQTSLPANVESSGAITLPARLLGDVLHHLGQAALHLEHALVVAHSQLPHLQGHLHPY